MKQLLEEAIKKLEETQEELVGIANNSQTLRFLVASQKHYEISKALSELRYVLATLPE